jgi:uncharacterized RDD family membrane protein YckC
MFCIRCGARLPEGAAFCASCGNPVPAGPHAPGAEALLSPAVSAPRPAAPAESLATRVTPDYGGFWRRLWSYVIDRFILGVVFTPVGLLFLAPLMATESIGWTDTDLPAEALTTLLGAVLTVAFLALLGSWLYYTILQSSSRQATLGQLALGIRVTDLEGRRISFARASGRYFATVLTGLTLGIGYLIMLLTARKQTLHDLLAGTLVVRSRPRHGEPFPLGEVRP